MARAWTLFILIDAVAAMPATATPPIIKPARAIGLAAMRKPKAVSSRIQHPAEKACVDSKTVV
ncbi:MAG: hypothetical protein JKY01_08150 [Pseudomonadales bacterium]|nr:hypothetical protein [Pseudomonadales bacterium]